MRRGQMIREGWVPVDVSFLLCHNCFGVLYHIVGLLLPASILALLNNIPY